MLNRRTLRIKAMQTLYAVLQAERSNYQLAQDEVTAAFQPDLNSMLPQNTERLEGLRKLALLQLGETAAGRPTDDEVPLEARKAAATAWLSLRDQNTRDRKRLSREALDVLDRLYDQYLLLLLLLPEVADEALLADERRLSDETQPIGRLAENQFIKALRELPAFRQEVAKRNLHWTDTDRVQYLRPFLKELRANAVFQQWLQKTNHTADEDAALVEHLVKQVVFRSEHLKTYFEDQNLRWSEDHDILRSLTAKTVRSFQQGDFRLQTLMPGGEEDRQFYRDLLENALAETRHFEPLIAAHTTHWEADRLALTDYVLLLLAMTEMVHFPGIPVKVSINEYIEIAKAYSTPKSGVFLNGVLDTLATQMRDQGLYRKSGRGLIDNR